MFFYKIFEVHTKKDKFVMIFSQVIHRGFGPYQEVVEIQETTLRSLEKNELLLKVLYSPINPADLNRIEGSYGFQPPMPAVLGNEGVAQIVEINGETEGLNKGDLVILPLRIDFWSEYLIAKQDQVFKIPSNIDPLQAAMLSVNPATAYCLLELFMPLKSQDWLILNAANSAVGSLIMQLAKLKGIKVLAMVRSEKAANQLDKNFADHIIIEDQIDLKSLKKDFKGLIKLGLNAVSGSSGEYLSKLLAPHACLVTYGAMAKKPLPVSFSSLVFREISYKGFWISKHLRELEKAEIQRLYEILASYFVEKKLHTKIERVFAFEDHMAALELASQTGRLGKVLLRF